MKFIHSLLSKISLSFQSSNSFHWCFWCVFLGIHMLNPVQLSLQLVTDVLRIHFYGNRNHSLVWVIPWSSFSESDHLRFMVYSRGHEQSTVCFSQTYHTHCEGMCRKCRTIWESATSKVQETVSRTASLIPQKIKTSHQTPYHNSKVCRDTNRMIFLEFFCFLGKNTNKDLIDKSGLVEGRYFEKHLMKLSCFIHSVWIICCLSYALQAIHVFVISNTIYTPGEKGLRWL